MIHGAMAFDGGVRGGNPGHAAFAAVITIAGNLKTIARPMRGLNTNNDAEYMGLIVGLKYATHLGVTQIDITSDSKLVVEQVNGNWRTDTKRMRDYKFEALELLCEFPDGWTLEWHARAHNIIADAACAQAMRCSLNPWVPNKLDPFFPNKALVKVSRA